MDDAVHDDAIGLLASGHNATLTYGPDGERRGEGMRVFVWAFAPKPRMLVFGAIDFAAAVARVGAFLGYHVTVCDARPVFATTSRFPEADEVVVDWPHRYLQAEQDAGRVDGRTVITVLTHDPKFDVPLLEVALRLPERRVRRGDGLAAYPRRPPGPAAGGGPHRRRRSPGCPARSASTSVHARPRRPRSASRPRSSPCSGGRATTAADRLSGASRERPDPPRHVGDRRGPGGVRLAVTAPSRRGARCGRRRLGRPVRRRCPSDDVR